MTKKFIFKPVRDKVIVKRFTSEEKVGAIYIPDNMREELHVGEVLAVGPGLDCHRRNEVENGGMIVKVGDKVILNKFTGLNFRFMGEKYLSISQKDIFAVIESSDTISNE